MTKATRFSSVTGRPEINVVTSDKELAERIGHTLHQMTGFVARTQRGSAYDCIYVLRSEETDKVPLHQLTVAVKGIIREDDPALIV